MEAAPTTATTTPHCIILIHGYHQTGKTSIISEYTGISKVELSSEDEFRVVQTKGTKDNVTIQCLPQEYGRMPVYRARTKAINETQAFIFTASEHSPYSITQFGTSYKWLKDAKKEVVPTVIIFTHKNDTVKIPSSLSKFAKKNNLKIETLNTGNNFEKVKLEKIIANLTFDALNPVTKSEEKEVVKKSGSSSPTLNRFIRFFSSFVNVGTAAA